MNPSPVIRYAIFLGLAVCAIFTVVSAGHAASPAKPQSLFSDAVPADPQIPSKQLLTAVQLKQMIASHKPLVLQIGPRSMYEQARIPGAEFIGGTSTPEGLDALRARVKSLPKNKLIVLYCGCCPWERCPNVHPGYKLLRDLGYTNSYVLYIANNFGVDWVNKGYPVERGN